VLRFSLSSAQLVDLAENTAAFEGPFSPSLAKNAFRAIVFPFFFLTFLAARRNTACYNKALIKRIFFGRNDRKQDQIANVIEEKGKEMAKYDHLFPPSWTT